MSVASTRGLWLVSSLLLSGMIGIVSAGLAHLAGQPAAQAALTGAGATLAVATTLVSILALTWSFITPTKDATPRDTADSKPR
jgi:hypothetical protein